MQPSARSHKPCSQLPQTPPARRAWPGAIGFGLGLSLLFWGSCGLDAEGSPGDEIAAQSPVSGEPSAQASQALSSADPAASEPSASPTLFSSPIYCNEAPPPGAKVAPPPPKYTGGSCPKLVSGKNAFKSTGHDRTFLLVVPKDLKTDELVPVVFLWHWLGGSADSFLRKGEVQAAADSQRFIAVLPESRSDMIFRWPFNVGDSAARQEEEYKFFDDMLSCVSEQFKVNSNCVSSVGVSAGALFTSQLAQGRAQYLASAISLSGGVGEEGSGVVKPWKTPARKVPMMVLWGGALDWCVVINFHTASLNLENALTKDGNFFLECIHNCKHGEPPMDTPPAGLSKYASLWRFVFDHPYWLAPGASPYKTSGIPTGAGFPAWCGIGKGSARTRTGMCPASGC
jgi:predicted esterase